MQGGMLSYWGLPGTSVWHRRGRVPRPRCNGCGGRTVFMFPPHQSYLILFQNKQPIFLP